MFKRNVKLSKGECLLSNKKGRLSGRGQNSRGIRPRKCTYNSVPGVFSNEDAFSERSYWDRRYNLEKNTFEWYKGYRGLKPLLLKYLKPDQPLLQVGVGTSTIQLDLVNLSGFEDITNLDYSSVCIDHMRSLHMMVPELKYLQGDVRKMTAFEDGCFGGVLDKGTLDALLCGDCADDDSCKMLCEVSRVLQPGGVYMMVTSQAPQGRYRYLSDPAYGWKVSVYEVGQILEMDGPYSLNTDKDLAHLGLPTMPYSHFVYVCLKI
ncbi:hypothetical protein CEUSTIGMA_g2028.t1 [Chlamydomonas eustigma]|uniref:Methyltransferase type 11 domain-containing protein n=1 Tax=Chlamydomonas eustigma TaxID=1157962 RepID=A0A250WV42_9CHLO|nr:hypothetical protein CEUSTIGMA_g2028.t1 [Chlamydomonas eustigma]|eukprot:GAX74579.1 hypothetical protein CEUSTIGMA_g2028.t1 [Chlamydomonas eustigma]